MESVGFFASLGFAWKLSFLLLLLPLALRFLPGKSRKDEYIYITSLPHYMNSAPKNKVRFLFALAYAAWFFLVIAIARPIYYDHVIITSQPHRDIMMAVDLSDSMEIKDMYDDKHVPVTRLSVVKDQLKEFIKYRERGEYHDRIGLIIFADHAYVLSPLTFDTKLLIRLVDEMDLSLAGQLTNIGEAINLSLDRFADAGTNQKVLILLSDGRNTAEGIQPLEAASLARDKDMKIYTIGFGGGTFSTDDRNSEQINTSSDLDEDTLKRIADITHGAYYRARDNKQLHGRYQEISYMEATESAPVEYQPTRELYQWPLFIAIILSVITGIFIRRING